MDFYEVIAKRRTVRKFKGPATEAGQRRASLIQLPRVRKAGFGRAWRGGRRA